MAQNANTACLFTKVKNISGKTRTFGYLGPHGKELAANETYLHRGNLITQLGALRSSRKFEALQRSLDERGSLEVISTPSIHLYDETADRTQVLALDDGELGMTDPCWASEGSSDFIDGSP